jgi:energy-coupling factor transporter ATP-binding protein EcfA2
MAASLDSIEVSGGFLGGLSLQFRRPLGLICIIGPRGSGKSTLIEAIRYGMGGAPGANKARQELLQANLGPSLITIRTTPDKAGPAYLISRRFRQPPTITTEDGRPVANVDMERGTFLPIDAYSSLEIESIADESLGEKRRMLIDELQGPQYRELLFTLSEHRRALEANADAIRNARQKVLDIVERIEELGDARARLASMPMLSAPDDASRPLTQASDQRRLNGLEAQALDAAIKQYAVFASGLRRVTKESTDSLSKLSVVPGSLNSDLLEKAKIVVDETVRSARARVEEILRDLEEGTGVLQDVSKRLADAHAEHEASYAGLQAKNAEVSAGIQQRMSAEQAVNVLVGLEAERENAKAEVARLLDERAHLKGTYLLERERISSERETIAKALEGQVAGRVRLRILRNADNLAYRTMLLDGLRGARVRNHEDILAALLRMRPEELAEVIEHNAVRELEAQTSLGEERCRKILDSFRASVDPFVVEIMEIEDRIAIELNVGTDSEANFKDASELSRGQKCTALLPLLLARRDTPLVIDQPEDNLDNHFIYETVVNTIKRLKSRRQMIFITHNANIPVLGEADLVVVMNSDGRRGYISKMGSVDDCQEDIVDLLEGGREAFDLRRRRYER